MVESFAWITERKNVLSLVFYLGAFLAYLRYAQGVVTGGQSDRWHRTDSIQSTSSVRVTGHFFTVWRSSCFSGVAGQNNDLFAAGGHAVDGLVATRQIRWRRDVLPTLPFFALALGLCAITAWLENIMLRTRPGFCPVLPQRYLIAGHAFWFYLGNLFWPANLCFVYPRWQPDPVRGGMALR